MRVPLRHSSLLATAAILAGLATFLPSTQVSGAEVGEFRITEFGKAKNTGQMKAPRKSVNSKKYTMFGGYQHPEAGMKNVALSVRRERDGRGKGTYFIGAYLLDSGTGRNRKTLFTYLQPSIGHLITYTKHNRTPLTFCAHAECTITRYQSEHPSVHFPGVAAALYVIGDGEHLIGVRRSKGGVCDVVVARPMIGDERSYS